LAASIRNGQVFFQDRRNVEPRNFEQLREDAFEEIEDVEQRIDTPNVAGTLGSVRLFIEALTAERDEAKESEANALRLMDQTAERLFEELERVIPEMRGREQLAHREGFLAGREKSVDDLGYECDRFERLADYEAHVARQRADHEREIRIAEAEAKEQP
jgi:hypothetical protein